MAHGGFSRSAVAWGPRSEGARDAIPTGEDLKDPDRGDLPHRGRCRGSRMGSIDPTPGGGSRPTGESLVLRCATRHHRLRAGGDTIPRIGAIPIAPTTVALFVAPPSLGWAASSLWRGWRPSQVAPHRGRPGICQGGWW